YKPQISVSAHNPSDKSAVVKTFHSALSDTIYVMRRRDKPGTIRQEENPIGISVCLPSIKKPGKGFQTR
ncbi:MAG: hypothetical protein K8I60_08695, partial [Anaerolineae bacterium]|nr:hypothetical protein [Anaerolineae bacterium]